MWHNGLDKNTAKRFIRRSGGVFGVTGCKKTPCGEPYQTYNVPEENDTTGRIILLSSQRNWLVNPRVQRPRVVFN